MRSLSLSALTLSSSLMMMMMMLLLSSESCRASISLPEMDGISLPEMDGDLPLYSIAGSNLDLEFMMDSEINRMLAAYGGALGALDRKRPQFDCGPGKQYCVRQSTAKKGCKVRGLYYRVDCK